MTKIQTVLLVWVLELRLSLLELYFQRTLKLEYKIINNDSDNDISLIPIEEYSQKLCNNYLKTDLHIYYRQKREKEKGRERGYLY